MAKRIVARALVRAASRLVSMPAGEDRGGVGTSADTARNSACATAFEEICA